MNARQCAEAINGWVAEHGRLSESHRDNLPNYLEANYEILNSFVVRNPNEHFGICDQCSNPERLYSINFMGLQYEARPVCQRCVGQMLLWGIAENRMAFGSFSLSYSFNDFFRMIINKFVEPMLPTTDESPEKCSMCIRPILTNTTQRTRNYSLRTATFAGKELPFHVSCSYECQRCLNSFGISVRNPNGGWAEHEQDEVRSRFCNADICGKCLDEVREQNDVSDCAECGSWYYLGDLSYDDDNGADYCRDCYREVWRECDECGREYSPARGRHSCYRGIHNYSHKPNPVFHGKAPYHFGIELEVEQVDTEFSIDSGVTIVENTLGKRAYMKEDGSLDNGFEIVTHPHSLDEFQKSVDWGFLSSLKSEGFRSWDTSSCGLHVHISRKAFADDSHLVRFMKLIYDNKGAVRNLAGRSSDYAKFNDSYNSGGMGLYRKVKEGLVGDGHFSAVNTDNCDTVEVRVFRGSLRKERVLSAVEFCHAAVEHTRNMKITPKERPLSWTKFLAFMVKESVRYPNLTLIMESTLNNFNRQQQRDNEENDN